VIEQAVVEIGKDGNHLSTMAGARC
jgi:hypothetical protein